MTQCNVCHLSLGRCRCVYAGLIDPIQQAWRELMVPEAFTELLPIEEEDQAALLRAAGMPLA